MRLNRRRHWREYSHQYNPVGVDYWHAASVDMFSLIARFVQYVSHALRYPVLEYAHPMPRTIRIYPGETGSLYRAIVTDLINVCALSQLEVVETPERSRPTLWIDNEAPVAGCITVCRYVGRHWRLLPVNPTTCASVDASLELLQSFLHPFIADTFSESIEMCDHVAVFASLLEDSFMVGESNHLNGFESDTLADVCWAAAWKHVMDTEGVTLEAEEYPNLYAWMENQRDVEGGAEEEQVGDKKGD